MYNNFYIRFNYKNIIPFNLKKKKLRVHANIIGSKTTNLYGFFIGGEVKFWYYYFGINGLKRDSVFLVKKFLNKKLGVFFISNFNMTEGKWSFPKIYEQYYKNYLFLKKKKMNLFRTNLIINDNSSFFNNIFNINYNNNININNIFQLNYIYNILYLIENVNINNKFNILYKFKKSYKLPLLYNNNNSNNNKIVLDLSSIQERFNKLKKFYWNWNFYLKRKLYKKKKNTNFIKKKIQIYKKKNWYFEQQSNIFFKKKWFFKKNNIFLNDFYLRKNIINIFQFMKMNKAINKVNKKNIVFLFYIFYLHFNFVKLYKNLQKSLKNKNLIYLKKKKNNNDIKNLIQKNMYNVKKFYTNLINIKLKNKKYNWIKYKFLKNLYNEYNKKNFIKFFLFFKKILKKFYKYKIFNKTYILNNLKHNNYNNLNNKNLIYYQLYKIWLRYNKIKKKKKLSKVYWLKKIYKKKYKKKYNHKNLYLLWLYYIIRRQYKYK